MQKKSDNRILFNPMTQITPFISTVESSRANMLDKYWKQVTTSENVKNSFVVNPEVKKVVEVNDHFKMYAPEDMIKIYFGNNVLIAYLMESKKIVTYYLPDYQDTNGASYDLFYVNSNQKIKKGELVYSYAPLDIENKIIQNGYRVKTAFMPFFGFTTEDSYVISDNFAKKAKIQYHEKIFIPISRGLKYFKRFEGDGIVPKVGDKVDAKKGIYSYIPFEEAKTLIADLSNLSEHEVKMISKKFGGKLSGHISNVKVHKVKKDIVLQGENLVNKKFFDELEKIYQEQYRKAEEELTKALSIIPQEELRKKTVKGILETHIFIKKLSQSSLTNKFRNMIEDLNLKDIDYVIEIDIEDIRESAYGDKFTSIYAGKGTVGLIIPDELTPVTENGEKIDIFINPLSIFGRNNWGVLFETLFGKIITDIEKDIKEDNVNLVFEKLKTLYENYLIKEYPELEDQDAEEALKILKENWEQWKENILKNGLFIYGAAFTNFGYKDLIEKVILPYQEKFNIELVKKEKVKLSKELVKWLQEIGLHSGVIEPDEDIWVDVYTGWNYYLKLYHTADSKYNMTNFAGRYTVTGQPVRGRRNQGGGHISWQTLGALFAAGATDIIKELYSIKSDSLNDKIDFMTQMIQDKYYLKDKYESRTKETVNTYLRLFGLKFNN